VIACSYRAREKGSTPDAAIAPNRIELMTLRCSSARVCMSKLINRFERASSAAKTALASTMPSPIADFSVMP